MTRLNTMARPHRRSSGTRRKSDASDLVAGAILGGTFGLIVGSLMSTARSQGGRTAPSVAGVSLEGVDLNRPFSVDLSVPEHAPTNSKIAAHHRAQRIKQEFEAASSDWRVESDFHPSVGRFVLVVHPAAPENREIAQRFLTNT